MPKFTIQTYINEGPNQMYRLDPGADLLVAGPKLEVEAANEHAALDQAWVIGNREGTQAWPRTTRSLCTGDVLVIGETAYVISRIGFDIIDGAALRRSIESGKRDPRFDER